jgi:hypothetical protein
VRKLLAVSIAVVGLAVMTGCPSASTLGLARTLDQGQGQFALSPGLTNVAWAGTNSSLSVPQIEVAVRYGITDNFEVGAKAWFLGAQIEGKVGLLRSNGESGVDLALNPALSYLGTSFSSGGTTANAGVTTISLPLLAGFNFAGHQLMIGPKLVDQIYYAGAESSGTGAAVTGNVLFAGSSFGFALKLSNSFRVMPEVSVLYPVANSTGAAFNPMFQVGVGFIFGGYSATPRVAPEVPARPPAAQEDPIDVPPIQ